MILGGKFLQLGGKIAGKIAAQLTLILGHGLAICTTCACHLLIFLGRKVCL